ncbi:TetR/AcrR family transcriptional regulator C-terminal domain-containing protein [Kitasatospora sp. NA04385]|uniref:TetR/AcrR family transcriptional regulator C-terminal domain-containing protein n=1 Tax=Kitasatospora sp. NA04385 TaxID=2742135 RepID=UPI00158FAEE0|nr:TetR/AcrR family transcriptional regulator C-terminal domain-containing protein [Kitasatospora sp. NA04385]QKW21680.1 TetR/AcrR family transcriptional regulator C-terminal domain-containing protein [Kitasatospora sp. NA04385]
MALRRDQVVRSALELLDEAGLDALSTRRLAERLGVRPGALYWHVANKQELLAGVADLILGEVVAGLAPPHGPWQQQLRRLAVAVRTALLAHQEAARLVATAQAAPGPTNAMRIAERIIAVLRGAGFDLTTAAFAGDALLSYITGFALQEDARGPRTRDDARARELAGALRAEGFPHMADWLTEWPVDRTEPFLAGLDLLLRGLATALPAPALPAAAASGP